MKKTSKVKFWLVILGVAVCATAVPRAHGMDKAAQKKLVRQARLAYYNLRQRGFAGAQADVRPQWEFSLKLAMQSNPSGAQVALERLKHLHFPLSIDSAGRITLTHQWDAPAPPDAETAEPYRQIYAAMDQGVSGFFQSWSFFMLDSPFPDAEEVYELEEVGGEYRLSYGGGDTSVTTMMTRGFAITEVRISTSEFAGTIRPQLRKTPQGFVLTGSVAEFKLTSGGTVQGKIQLDYQDVGGLRLPYRIHFDGLHNGKASDLALVFVDWRLKGR